MFVMRSKYGNEIKKVETPRKRDELKALGYTEVEDKPLTVDEMKVEQLEAYAKEKGIDLTGCKNKTEKLAKIKEFEKESEE
ncbi:MAG: hypothetical protein J6B80_00435 [Clostridia bacterium]|nr:hypothetical protein [Clostridia bacterium]